MVHSRPKKGTKDPLSDFAPLLSLLQALNYTVNNRDNNLDHLQEK